MTVRRILVVDDEAPVRGVLDRVLKKAGFAVSMAETGREGLRSAEKQPPDAIILDLNLPDISGEEVCKQIRKLPSIQAIPILILTGQIKEGLPAECLDGGADDYLNKPFDINELGARMRALLRRPRLFTSEDAVIEKAGLTIRVGERKILWKGRTLDDFTPKEFELLAQLALHAPRVLEKSMLATKVWGVSMDQLNPRTLDVHVRRIRKKLGPQGSAHLKTVPSIGFQWLDGPLSRKPPTL